MLKKLLSTILLAIMLVSFAEPIFAFSSSGTGKWVAGQYNSGIKTTDSKGVIIRRLTNYTTKEKITVFCTEFGVDSSTGVVETAQHIVPTDPLMKTACKIAYFGWYSRYGEYAVDGGILTEGFKQVKLDYVFTQQMIWEILNQSNATFIESNIQNQYILFKNQINSNIENMEKKPSFCNQTITLDIGQTITLTDTNGVLAGYTSIDKTIEGIRLLHNKGENTMTISVSNECTLENYTISEDMMKSWGVIKESTKNNDTTVFFSFKDGVQDQLYAMHYNDPVTMSMNLKINLLGKLELTKLDKEGQLIDGAVFEINGPDNFYKEVIVTNGRITIDNLKRGNYTIKEKIAPNGYLLDTNIYTVEVLPNHVTTQAITNEEPTGTISIIKKDSETGSIPQGDATLENAVYNVYANEDIYNVTKTKKYYSKGDLVATRTTNVKGETEDVCELPLGKYIVKEEQAPIGYMIDTKEYNVNLTYKDQYTKVITERVTSADKVKKMQVHIYKTGTNGNSGLIAGLAGAEFTIKLYSDVEKALKDGYSYAEIWNGLDEYGESVKVDSKRAQEAQKIAPTYEVIITDANGDAYTQQKLPYGKYVAKETKIPQNFIGAKDFIFSITQDESEIQEIAQKVKHLVVNNQSIAAYIKLIKKDAKTGKTVTLNSSTFEIKATEDIYDVTTGKILYPKGQAISQKIGGTTYSSFTTNADNIVVPENSFNTSSDDKGSVTTPLLLPAGSYEITEVKEPKGFLQLEKPINFKIENIKDLDRNQDGDCIIEVIIQNEQPTGTLIIHKSIAIREKVDTSLIDINDLSGIQFKLTAKEDVIDSADGSIIYKKGQEIGIYNVDKNGDLIVENLPMGIYELQEVKTLDGLVLDNTKYEVKFTQKDQVTKVYTETKEILNMPILKTIRIIKADSETKDIIKASFKFAIYEDVECTKLIKEVNSVIENGTVTFANLKYGTYYIKEIQSPNGYLLSDKIIKIEINAQGTFADGELLEDDNSICTFIYYNQKLPIIQTGSERNYPMLLSSLLISVSGLILLSSKKQYFKYKNLINKK